MVTDIGLVTYIFISKTDKSDTLEVVAYDVADAWKKLKKLIGGRAEGYKLLGMA